MMGMPVNRLKIMAFAFGAGIAGLAGSVFAATQTGAFPQNFSTQVLILIYAVVILGGTGSLTGMIVGAVVIIASNQVLDSTSPPNVGRVRGDGGLRPGRARDRGRGLVPRHRRPGHVGRLPDRPDPQLGAAADEPG